jgi:hypothetical protein
MKILTIPQYASGFFYEAPVEKIPAITTCKCDSMRPGTQ